MSSYIDFFIASSYVMIRIFLERRILRREILLSSESIGYRSKMKREILSIDKIIVVGERSEAGPF